MNFLKILNKKGDKFVFYRDFGRGKGQRVSTGIFIYRHPKNQTEKNHNKEMLAVIELKKSQLTINIILNKYQLVEMSYFFYLPL